MKNILNCFLGIIVIGCHGKKETPKLEPLIISHLYNYDRNHDKDTTEHSFPPPPPVPGGANFYGSNNFILDRNDSLYYYEREPIRGFMCGNYDSSDTIPHFISLLPQNLIAIPKNSIAGFATLNLRPGVRNFIHIASQKDTLASDTYFKLIEIVEKRTNDKDRDIFVHRRTTQEEDVVLQYKKSDKWYSADAVRWDSTRIAFPKLKRLYNH